MILIENFLFNMDIYIYIYIYFFLILFGSYPEKIRKSGMLLSSPVHKCLSLSKQRQLSPDSFNKPQTKSRVIKSLILVNEHINSRGSV